MCWVSENFSGGPGHRFSVWDSAVWSAGPVQFIWVLAWGGWRDCTGFSLYWLCCGGCGTVEMVGGWSGFLFFLLYFAVGSPGVWLPVVGFSSFIN